ncbi:hypothetical protein ACVWYO_001268 [Sphingomonas sp. UYP23]
MVVSCVWGIRCPLRAGRSRGDLGMRNRTAGGASSSPALLRDRLDLGVRISTGGGRRILPCFEENAACRRGPANAFQGAVRQRRDRRLSTPFLSRRAEPPLCIMRVDVPDLGDPKKGRRPAFSPVASRMCHPASFAPGRTSAATASKPACPSILSLVDPDNAIVAHYGRGASHPVTRRRPRCRNDRRDPGSFEPVVLLLIALDFSRDLRTRIEATVNQLLGLHAELGLGAANGEAST